MSKLHECFLKYSLSVQKIQYCSHYILIYTEKQIYLFLENDIQRNHIFSLFKEINYPFYQQAINQDDDTYGLYLFHEDQFIDFKGKIMIQALAYLHQKTLSINSYSEQQLLDLYHSIQKKIQSVLDYYENLLDYIQSFSFPRIDYYCLIINISIIFQSIYQAFYYLDEWYHHKNRDIRKALLIPNSDFDNFCYSKNSYFYDFRGCKEDLLVYDFVSFYRCNYDKDNMKNLFLEYQKTLPYSMDEKELLFCLISIPNIVSFESSIYHNTVRLTKEFDYIKKTEMFVSEENKEDEKTDE